MILLFSQKQMRTMFIWRTFHTQCSRISRSNWILKSQTIGVSWHPISKCRTTRYAIWHCFPKWLHSNFWMSGLSNPTRRRIGYIPFWRTWDATMQAFFLSHTCSRRLTALFDGRSDGRSEGEKKSIIRRFQKKRTWFQKFHENFWVFITT